MTESNLTRVVAPFEPRQVTLCNANSGPFFVYTRDEVIGASILKSGHFGEHKIDEVVLFLQEQYAFKALTFIDIGANIGTHIIHALTSDKFKDGIAIEADPDNLLLLQANLAIRGLNSRAQVLPLALSSVTGDAELELCSRNFGDHRVRVQGDHRLSDLGESSRKTRNVKSAAADSVLGERELNWSRTLTWIDTQGHEGHILAGGKSSLCSKAPAVVIEFWPYGLERADGKVPVFDFLSDCLAIFDINKDDWPREGRVQVSELLNIYEQMLLETCADHYPHTDLLCVRKPLGFDLFEIPPNKDIASMNELERSLMTISCRDTDSIPKVPAAGSLILRGDQRLQLMHNGIEVVYGGYHGEWMAHIIRGLKGHHEPQEELVFHNVLRYVRNGTRMVELGCFWAYYTQWFLREIPNSTGLCIEPDPHNLSIGRRNTELNGHDERVNFLQAWIGGETLSAHTATIESSPSCLTLPMLNAESVLDQGGGASIEMLHLDIQGAELAFLHSIDSQMAKQHLRFIMISTHHSSISDSKTTHVDCVDHLRSLGATILVEHNVIESFSGDGLILASTQECDRDLWFPEISRNRAERSLFKTF